MNKYVIIDEQGGWLVNTVVWDGNLENWQPPAGTIAKPIEDVNIVDLPPNPDGFL